MTYLATYPQEAGVTVKYWDPALPEGATLDLEFTRTVMGVTFPDPTISKRQTGYGYACLIGERTYPARGNLSLPPERVYVIIDEQEHNTATALFDGCVALKDKYRASMAWCPSKPQHLAESFRTYEGLVRYQKNMSTPERRTRWATYVGDDVRLSVREIPPITGEAAHRALESVIAAQARYPDTGELILGSDKQPIPRLFLPQGFKNAIARREIQQESMPEVALALWRAIDGLERSRPRRPAVSVNVDGYGPSRRGNPITGY